MTAPSGRPAFYARGGGRLGEAITLLHPPYTLWHLSYFALGAGLAPHLYTGRLLWGLGAFFLAVGISAHALDELNGRPLGTSFSDRTLRVLALAALLGALAIGVGGVLTVSLWLIPFVLAGAAIVPAYNLELGGGRFHGDRWFALAWGAFPAFTGYFVNAISISATGVLIAAGCMALSGAQRTLSTAARELRRRTVSLQGVRERSDGATEALSVAGLLGPLDGALALLSLSVPLLAAALLAWRL